MSGLQAYQISRLIQEMGMKTPVREPGQLIDALETQEDKSFLTDTRYTSPSGSWHIGDPVAFVSNLRLFDEKATGMAEYILPRRVEMMVKASDFLTRIHLYFIEASRSGTSVYVVPNTTMPWRDYLGRDDLYHIPLPVVRWPTFPSAGPNCRFHQDTWNARWWKDEWLSSIDARPANVQGD